MKNKLLKQLFTKEMDRKQFLSTIGLALLAIIGVTQLLQNLLHYEPGSKKPEDVNKTTYG